ncbi:MAG: PA2778 family cysteine peptidase [Pseudomonadota bacterium]
MRQLLTVLTLVLAGCASGPPLRDYNLPATTVELTDTPFFAQSQYQCGPAALATVLGASGVKVTPEALKDQVYLPERRGSLQVEMVAATRRHDRIPYVLKPDFNDLLAEVSDGTPVLVMQNLGLRILPRWHYAVVIGYDTASDSLMLRSGTQRRLTMNRIRFQATWARADNWAMVAALPDRPSTTAEPISWLRAARDFEDLGEPELALQAYKAATIRWPLEPLTWQVLANGYFASGDLVAAESALRRSLELSPSATAYNNLAHVLYKRGRLKEAKAELSRAEAMAEPGELNEVLAHTRAAIDDKDNSDFECSPSAATP